MTRRSTPPATETSTPSRRSAGDRVQRLLWGINPWLVITVVMLFGFVYWALNSRTQPHHVRAVFTDAFNIYPGLDVRSDGIDIGRVSAVSFQSGDAVVRLGISDPAFWPLRQGTRAQVRWGTTIGSGTRYVELFPGPRSAPALPEDGLIPVKDTTPAVNVDQVLNALTPDVRGHIVHMQGALASGLSGETGALNRGIASTPQALTAADAVFQELSSDTAALKALAVNGSRTMSTLAGEAPQISDVVTVAARTMQVFQSHTSAMESAISELPDTLSTARGTLARVDGSLGILTSLVTDLRPGVARLTPLANTARPALADLETAVPPLLSTVTALTHAAPSLTRTLTDATPLVSHTAKLSTALTPMFSCIRPYAPEIGGAVIGLNGWFESYTLVPPQDPQQQLLGGPTRYPEAQNGGLAEWHGVDAVPTVGPDSFHSYPPGFTDEDFAKIFGKVFADPRPPGYGVDTPNFFPQCGITQNALNAADDPEQGMP